MTDNEDQEPTSHTQTAHRLFHQVFQDMLAQGAEPRDVLIGAFYATHDLGTVVTGSKAQSLKWMKIALGKLKSGNPNYGDGKAKKR